MQPGHRGDTLTPEHPDTRTSEHEDTQTLGHSDGQKSRHLMSQQMADKNAQAIWKKWKEAKDRGGGKEAETSVGGDVLSQ